MSYPKPAVGVLIVDDSSLARDLIRCILTEDPSVLVVGEASNGREAVAKVAELKPDVVTMDIEMPVMGGLDAIETIMAESPVPILVLTALRDASTAFSAISKGALEVLEKPDIGQAKGAELIRKVRLLAGVRVVRRKIHAATVHPPPTTLPASSLNRPHVRIVAIAASTGGPEAIFSILSHLPADFAIPIVVAQHIANGFAQGMAEWLTKTTPFAVRVAGDGQLLSAGTVSINPSEHSMRVTGQGILRLAERDEHTRYHPSCNAFLCSVAESYREHAAGIILSGMGDDGVTGMGAIKQAGGITLAQDENSSLIYGMNRHAVDQGCVDKVLALQEIPDELVRIACLKDRKPW